MGFTQNNLVTPCAATQTHTQTHTHTFESQAEIKWKLLKTAGCKKQVILNWSKRSDVDSVTECWRMINTKGRLQQYKGAIFERSFHWQTLFQCLKQHKKKHTHILDSASGCLSWMLGKASWTNFPKLKKRKFCIIKSSWSHLLINYSVTGSRKKNAFLMWKCQRQNPKPIVYFSKIMK